MNNKKVIKTLSKIFDLELTGVVRYTHYALMIFGSNRLPLIEFFRAQAKESLMHADLAGEHITGLGGHPPLNTNNIEETHKHSVKNILEETLGHEEAAIKVYYELQHHIYPYIHQHFVLNHQEIISCQNSTRSNHHSIEVLSNF